ncbi:MAG: SRPBCC family protein [Planctomycetota bacterium]
MTVDTTGRIGFGRDGKTRVLRAEQWLPAAPDAVWRFVADCRHMNHVIPRFVRFEVRGWDGTPIEEHHGPPPTVAAGGTYDYRLHLHGLGVRWRTLITEVDALRRFVDEQAKGPYAAFAHEHTFEPTDDGTLTRDVIRYRPPGGPLAGLVDRLAVRRDLRALFVCRHRRLAELFAEHPDPAALLDQRPTPGVHRAGATIPA